MHYLARCSDIGNLPQVATRLSLTKKTAAIESISEKLLGLEQYEGAYASPLQFEQIRVQVTELRETFTAQSQQLKEIEEALGNSQKKERKKRNLVQQEYKNVERRRRGETYRAFIPVRDSFRRVGDS